MMAVIRPTQFSALKVLDHPHKEKERGEDDDGYADDQEVIHGGSLAVTARGRHREKRGAWLTRSPNSHNQSPDQRAKLPS
jgi:hypothetical protein